MIQGPNIKRLYYSTTEVSKLVKLRPYIIRKWEEKFSFLNSVKKQSGRRLFRPDDLDVILEIKRLKEKGFTNEKIHEIICDDKESISSDETVNSSKDYWIKPLLSEIYRELQEILEILNK